MPTESAQQKPPSRRPFIPHPSGVMTRTSIDTGFPDQLDNTAASIRQNNPPAFTPPKATAGDTSVPTRPSHAMADRFPKPDNVTNTVVYRHGDSAFPIHRKENFAARTTLKPNTEYIIEHRSEMRDSTGALQGKHHREVLHRRHRHSHHRVDTYAGVKGAWSPELNKPMPNVTYNVVAQVDGGLQNTFTLKMDSNGHLESAKGHIVSTLVGDINRNGYQQRKAGWLGGPGYDGGHAAPSFFGFIGERGGLFPQHEWQNRKAGTPNEINETNNFHDIEMEVIRELKARLARGEPVSLNWEMELVPSSKAGLPANLRLRYNFAGEEIERVRFNNLNVDGDLADARK